MVKAWGGLINLRPVGFMLTLLFLLASSQVARGQLVHVDPIPWRAAADSTSRLALEVHADHAFDPRIDWTLNRLLLTVILPGGKDGIYFVRMSHMTFDSGNVPLLERWPDIQGPDMDSSWPASGRVKGFGQVQAGTCGQLQPPGLGRIDYGAALGLPVGTDDLYPFSTTSMLLQLELRKELALSSSLYTHGVFGYLSNVGSGRSGLDPEAFASGYHGGADIAWYRGRGSRLVATLDAEDRGGRSSLKAGMQCWFPWTDEGSFGVQVTREFAGPEDRAALWFVSLAWRFDSSKYRGLEDGQGSANNAKRGP